MSSEQNLRYLNELVHHQTNLANLAQRWLTVCNLYGSKTHGFHKHKSEHWNMLRRRLEELGGNWTLSSSIELIHDSNHLDRLLGAQIPVERKTQEFMKFLLSANIAELEKAFRESGDLVTAAMIKLVELQDQEDLRALNVITSVPT